METLYLTFCLQSCILNAQLHKSFREVFGDKAMSGYVVHPGDVRLPLGQEVIALPFSEL